MGDMGAAGNRVKRSMALNIKAEFQSLWLEQVAFVAHGAHSPKRVARTPIAAIRGARAKTLAAEGPSSLRWIS
jgi:hypothetical protein